MAGLNRDVDDGVVGRARRRGHHRAHFRLYARSLERGGSHDTRYRRRRARWQPLLPAGKAGATIAE